MKRRSFIKSGTALGVAASVNWRALANLPFQNERAIKTVLRGGKCFYQNAWQKLDVGIGEDGRIKTGPPDSLEAPEIISVKERIISAGFVDILADNAANPRKTYSIFEKYKVTDGVTTALQMHGGSSNCAAYYQAFDALPHRINFGVSTAVMQVRNATSDNSKRRRQVEKCLEEGALGVSHSLEYQPTSYEETIEYARLARKYERPFFLHLRYSSTEKELEGVDEAIRLAKDSGAHLHIDHLHSTGGTFHMEEALDKIQAANAMGFHLTCCVYPYSFWATYLHSKRFDEGWQKRYGMTYHDLQLVGTDERLTAESFKRYREMKKLVAVPEGTMPLSDTVDLALKRDFCMIGSDGGIEYEPRSNSHPRGAGCFASSLRHCLAIGVPLEKALEKMTAMPRSLILPAMNDRGVLANGAWADLAVIDPARVNGKATVSNPNQFSEGIEMVFVNGKPAYRNGKLEAMGGIPIRY